MTFIPRKVHKYVNDPQRELWWKTVGEAPHITSTGSRAPTLQWSSQGQNSSSWYPCGYLMQQGRKGATYNFQKSHLRRAWGTSQSHFEIFTFGLTSTWQPPLNQGSSVQSTQDATGLLNGSRASKPSQHTQYIPAGQTGWGCSSTSLKVLNKSELNNSIVLMILFSVKTIKCAPLSVLLTMHYLRKEGTVPLQSIWNHKRNSYQNSICQLLSPCHH